MSQSDSPYAGKSHVIAFAGATGNVGRQCTEALLAAGFKVVLLLRRENPQVLADLVPFVPSGLDPSSTLYAEVVDFTSSMSLATVFKKHHVDTIISSLALVGADEWKTEDNMLKAGIDAGVKRFAPSNFAGPVERSHGVRGYEFKRKILEQLKDAPISWTHFTTGIFMNYFASGAPPQANISNLGHLQPLKFIVDVENGTATIPGSGPGDEQTPTAFTEIYDVAQGVVSACSLESAWTPMTGCMNGGALTYGEVVRLAEKIRGRKFEVKYMPLDELDRLCTPKTDGDDAASIFSTFYYEAMRMIAQGGCPRVEDGLKQALAAEGKEQMFQPIGVEAFLEKWWSSSQ